MTCEHCQRTITEADERERYEPGDRDQPSYYEPACRFCSPSEFDNERAREERLERLLDERREGWA
jgi:hypothetical protein